MVPIAARRPRQPAAARASSTLPKNTHASRPKPWPVLRLKPPRAAQNVPVTSPTVNSGKPIVTSLSPSESSTSSGGRRWNTPTTCLRRSSCSWIT